MLSLFKNGITKQKLEKDKGIKLMSLFRKNQSKKLTKYEKERAKRMQRQLSPTTQNTLKYTSLFEKKQAFSK